MTKSHQWMLMTDVSEPIVALASEHRAPPRNAASHQEPAGLAGDSNDAVRGYSVPPAWSPPPAPPPPPGGSGGGGIGGDSEPEPPPPGPSGFRFLQLR
jgi:hypothetical protein